MDRFCVRCRRRAQRHGHPGQERVLFSFLQLDRVRAFLKENRQHPGIPLAIEWLTELARINGMTKHGVTGKDVFPRLLGVALLNENRPGFFRDQKAYAFALAHAFLNYWIRIPKGRTKRKTPPLILQRTGEQIIAGIGVLLMNAGRAMKDREPQEAPEQEQQHTPTPPRRIIRTRGGSIRTDH